VALQRIIVTADQVGAEQITLTQPQQHYLYRVLRLAPGNQFVALDGQGQQWIAKLTDVSAVSHIVNTMPANPADAPTVTLAMALPKGSGFDEVVRQATELGVSCLQPVISDRTLHHPNPKKLERWRRIAAEATEQSERLWLPQVLPPLAWNDYLQQVNGGHRWLCVARGGAPHLLAVAQTSDRAQPITLAIGPEGGWTTAEIAAAVDAGFQTVSLGPHILRAVTAPLAALALIAAVHDVG
jgi:16S rRNA (uracil1498-N3)-methyltransferase